MEDHLGNLWFGTGAGLCNDLISHLFIDSKGTFWIGTRVAQKDNSDTNKRSGKGGLNKYDGEKFIHFPEIEGLNKSDVFTLYKDNIDRIWVSTTGNGGYTFENNKFVHYDVPKSTMSFLKDKAGNMWLGCAGGLYQIHPNGELGNIRTNGPWK